MTEILLIVALNIISLDLAFHVNDQDTWSNISSDCYRIMYIHSIAMTVDIALF